jgi:hypothetical protein
VTQIADVTGVYGVSLVVVADLLVTSLIETPRDSFAVVRSARARRGALVDLRHRPR